MKKIIGLLSVITLIALSACSKVPDLDAPCPDYGRHCHQIPINAWDNEGLQQ